MSSILRKFFDNRRDTFIYGFIIVFVIKLATIYYFNQLTFENSPEFKVGRIASASGDMYSYIGAMDNYIETGSYYFINPVGEKIYAGRMPYYSVPYYLLRQLFSKETSLDIYIIFQILLEALAIIIFSYVIFKIFNKGTATIAFFTLLISVFNTYWNGIILIDGPATSFLMISYGLFALYVLKKESRIFYWSAFSLIASVTIRPYFVLFLFPLILFETIRQFRNRKIEMKKFLFPALFGMVLFSPWVIRNFIVLKKFIPFQQDLLAGYGMSDTELKLRSLLADFGEDGGVYWDNKTAASYFYPGVNKNSKWEYPQLIKNNSELHNAFEKIKQQRLEYGTGNNTIVQKSISSIREIYKNNYPVNFYLLGPIKRVKKMFFHSGSYYLPINKSFKSFKPLQLVLKLSQSLLYYAVLILGTIGLVLLIMRKRYYIIFLIPLLVLTLLFPVYLKTSEWRFLIPFYSFSVVGLSFLIHKLYLIYVRRCNKG